MLDVPFTAEAASLARQRYERVQERRAREATTPDEYARRAQAAVGAGTFALVFDGVDDAHDAFADAVADYTESVEGRVADPTGTDYAALPLHAWRGAYAALLAGDRGGARTLADAVSTAEQSPEPGIELDAHPYFYARAVAAAAAGDDDAREALRETEPANEWAAATTEALRGAITDDRTAFESSLNELLEGAHERAEQGSEMDLRSMVFAAEPTALTLLAWDRGMGYDPDSRLVPSGFLWATLPLLRE
ncbi:MAG: Imm49 family immunity protein [Halolamina sp.]